MKDQTDPPATWPNYQIKGEDPPVPPAHRKDVCDEPGPAPSPGAAGAVSLQLVLIAIAEATHDLDIETLSGLDEQALAAQRAARWELYRYLDQLWCDLKAVGLQGADPAVRQGLAGLRDVAGGLCAAIDHLRYRRTPGT